MTKMKTKTPNLPFSHLPDAAGRQVRGWALPRDHGSRSASGRIAGAIPGKAPRVRPRTSSRRPGRAIPRAFGAAPCLTDTETPLRGDTEIRGTLREWPHLRSMEPMRVGRIAAEGLGEGAVGYGPSRGAMRPFPRGFSVPPQAGFRVRRGLKT